MSFLDKVSGFGQKVAQKEDELRDRVEKAKQPFKDRDIKRRVERMDKMRMDNAFRKSEVKLKEESHQLDRREERLRPKSGGFGAGAASFFDMGSGVGSSSKGKGKKRDDGFGSFVDMGPGFGGSKGSGGSIFDMPGVSGKAPAKKKRKSSSKSITIHIKK